MATLQEQIIETLLSIPSYYRGAGRSDRYEHIYYDGGQYEAHYWVGKAGALRKGDTISKSISLASGQEALDMVLQWKATGVAIRKYSAELDAARSAVRGRVVKSTKFARVQWEKRADQAVWREHALAICELPWAVFVAYDDTWYQAYREEQAAAARAMYAEVDLCW